MAEKSPSPIPKAIAGASLLTDVALNKYQYHLPLYRQSKIMKSNGILVSDKTLANWVMASGEALTKVYGINLIGMRQCAIYIKYYEISHTLYPSLRDCVMG